MRRVEEHLLRRDGQRHVRIAHVDRDVAPVRALPAHGVGEFLRIGEGLPEEQATPAAIDHGVGAREHRRGIGARGGVAVKVGHGRPRVLPSRVEKSFTAAALVKRRGSGARSPAGRPARVRSRATA